MYARYGWPVFPCRPGTKVPATRHGFRDATTDLDRITRWWRRQPDANVAIATGLPGPDVLDVDQHGAAGSGFGAFNRVRRAGLAEDVSAIVRTPSGGFHAYFTGSDQPCGRLRSQHLDFRARGGYIVAPPSRVGGKPYLVVKHEAGAGVIDWGQVAELLEPERARAAIAGQPAHSDPGRLAAWLATQGADSHNRNDGLFWAACRVAEAGDHAALTELAHAARSIGLSDREISRTIESACRTARPGHGERHGTREAAL